MYLAGLGTVGLEIYEQVPSWTRSSCLRGGHCGVLTGTAAANQTPEPSHLRHSESGLTQTQLKLRTHAYEHQICELCMIINIHSTVTDGVLCRTLLYGFTVVSLL